MACGVTKTVGGQTVTCDNSGTSSHTGPHSGLMTIYGFTGIRTWWYASALTPVAYKPLLPGYRARSATGWYTTIPGGTPPTAPPSLVAAGMNLASNYSPANGNWAQVPNWSARSGFTGVTIENNQLKMNGDGRVRVHIKGNLSASGFGYTVSKRLTKNGVTVQDWSDVATEHTVDIDVLEGDLLGYWLSYSGFVSACTLNAGTGTFLYTELI